MSKPVKEFHEYIERPKADVVRLAEYESSPACAFLRYTLEAKDAVEYCKKYFPKEKNPPKKHLKIAQGNIEHVISAFLPTVMGHFETFQKYLFAGLFESTAFIPDFDSEEFFKHIKKNTREVVLDPIRLSAYRGQSAQVGLIIADSLKSWHNPHFVNSYFKAFGPNAGFQDFYSSDDQERLLVLWQLRHSIVHTASKLTLPDSQKVPQLNGKGDSELAFGNNFIFELSRKMHRIVKDSMSRLRSDYTALIPASTPVDQRKKVDDLLLVKSSVSCWL